MTEQVVWYACQQATKRAGIDKPVPPRTRFAIRRPATTLPIDRRSCAHALDVQFRSVPEFVARDLTRDVA